ncbi:MAG: hypothetical protein EOO30_13050 [Comamonadaceae bacterium]|nr:MAG: hypothetical protein EOO30_13050 [Comamonadaceae bacterium]
MPVDHSEVLRGMHVEAAPFRLLRTRQATPKECGAPDSSPQEAATRQGYEAGLQRGHAEGLRRGHEEGGLAAREECRLEAEAALQKAIAEATAPLREQEATFRALVASIEGEERSRLLAAEDEMVALCYETVCAVFGARAIRPAIVRAHLASIRAQASEGGGLALHVHPDDAALLAGAPSLSRTHETPALAWVADPEVTLGGCKVVQRGGGLDLRLETALERCKELLLQARNRRRAGARQKP